MRVAGEITGADPREKNKMPTPGDEPLLAILAVKIFYRNAKVRSHGNQ
jgi:hypothetical protein